MGILLDAVTLHEEIQKQRSELHRIANCTESLLHPSVITASQRLDLLIVQAQRQKRLSNKFDQN